MAGQRKAVPLDGISDILFISEWLALSEFGWTNND